MVEALGWGVRLPWGWGSIVLRAQKGWSFLNGRGFGAWVYGYGPKGSLRRCARKGVLVK